MNGEISIDQTAFHVRKDNCFFFLSCMYASVGKQEGNIYLYGNPSVPFQFLLTRIGGFD